MPEFIYFIEPTRDTFPGDASDVEMATMGEHFAYVKAALAEGKVILVGRTQDENPVGICIFEAADMEAANEFSFNDPGVRAGIVRCTVRPYQVALMRGRD